MLELKFIDGKTASAEMQQTQSKSDIQIALLDSTYEDARQLFKKGNFETLEALDVDSGEVKIITGYSKVSSFLELFAEKNDFWKGSRIIVVVSKEDMEE